MHAIYLPPSISFCLSHFSSTPPSPRPTRSAHTHTPPQSPLPPQAQAQYMNLWASTSPPTTTLLLPPPQAQYVNRADLNALIMREIAKEQANGSHVATGLPLHPSIGNMQVRAAACVFLFGLPCWVRHVGSAM